MKVFKFGGGILNSPEAIRRLPSILEHFPGQDLLLVISAFGKTTNALEALLNARNSGGDWVPGFERLKNEHHGLLNGLMPKGNPAFQVIDKLFLQLREKLQMPAGHHDQDYDQVVCYGELISSVTVQHYLAGSGLNCRWIDVREVIRTDLAFRDAKVNMELSREKAGETFAFLGNITSPSIIVTQGFIGGGPGGMTTTLGREGSDYSAALLANLLDAEQVIIWKDVPGIMNADPALFEETVMFDRISYAEATELAFYGAKVIHPKTTKPLQNKNIPLRVKSYLRPEDPGTLITAAGSQNKMVPSYIIKNDQVLITISTRDLSFITDQILLDVFSALTRRSMKVNILQNSALTLSVCLDDRGDFKDLLGELHERYVIRYNDGLTLVTIRHHTQEAVEKVLKGKEILLEQQNRTVAQFVVR